MIVDRTQLEFTLAAIAQNLATYYNEMRTHVALGEDASGTRPIERFGDIISEPTLGGLLTPGFSFRKRQVAHDAIHYITGIHNQRLPTRRR